MAPISVSDRRQLAKRRLPRTVFDYLEGGAGDERGMRRNLAAFEAIASRRDGWWM